MKPKQVYVTYIQTDIDSLWAALTEPDQTEKYFYDTRILIGAMAGDEVIYDDGTPTVYGKILEISPKTKLVYTFKGDRINGDDNDREPHSRVTYELETTENAVKFTLIHDEFESENSTFNSVANGWPWIISGLKTLLETTKPLKM